MKIFQRYSRKIHCEIFGEILDGVSGGIHLCFSRGIPSRIFGENSLLISWSNLWSSFQREFIEKFSNKFLDNIRLGFLMDFPEKLVEESLNKFLKGLRVECVGEFQDEFL